MRVRSSRKALLLILAGFALAIPLTSSLWLPVVASVLIKTDEPQAADYAVVLAGDGSGKRILAAADLVRRGLARRAVVDGPHAGYGLIESDLAVDFAVARGYPRDYFLKLPIDATSTRKEADAVIAELRRLKARSFLLVTSNFHTRRARGYFRDVGIPMRVIGCEAEHFAPDSWWRTREGQKIVYLEWSKTVAAWLGN